jgi:hypothetical protein
VFDRLVGAGLSQERIEQHLTAGRVRVDGERVTARAGAPARADRAVGARRVRWPVDLTTGPSTCVGVASGQVLLGRRPAAALLTVASLPPAVEDRGLLCCVER